jgi:hypothetical protein
MNARNVANIEWALANFNMPPAGSLRNALWAAAKRVAPIHEFGGCGLHAHAAENFGCMPFVCVTWGCAGVQNMECTSLGIGS